MTIEEVKQKLSTAGYHILKEERLSNNTGWRLRLNGGAIVNVFNNRNINFEGKNYQLVETLLKRDIVTASHERVHLARDPGDQRALEAHALSPAQRKDVDYFALRVVMFLVLVVGINLWLDHHLGLRLANTSVISMLIAALAGGLGLLERLLSKGEQESLTSRALGVARVVFWPLPLVVAWVIALVLALTLSSVTIVAETEGGRFKAQLTQGAELQPPGDDASGKDSKDGVVRFTVPTNPLGRAMRLRVAGYVPATIDVYPLVGRRIVLGSDMRPSPSVLLRLPLGVHSLLDAKTRLVVRRRVGDHDAPVADTPTKKNRSAFLLGRRREVPVSLVRDWEIELEADGVSRSNPGTVAMQATMLKEWRNPSPLEHKVTLEPGMTLIAELHAPGALVAVATVTLSSEPFQDVALRAPEEE